LRDRRGMRPCSAVRARLPSARTAMSAEPCHCAFGHRGDRERWVDAGVR
jgi:hypothetical protein